MNRRFLDDTRGKNESNIIKVISEEDRLKISNLFLFYRVIEKYAEDNNILPYQVNPSSYSECTFYLISFNDFCFQIGITSGLGNMIYCKKAPRKLDTILQYFTNKIKKFKKLILNYFFILVNYLGFTS